MVRVVVASVVVLLAGCGSASAPVTPAADGGTPCSPDYPAASTGAADNTAFFGIGADGTSKVVRFSDYYDACAASSRLFVVRIDAGWCGTCLWHASHTKPIVAGDLAARLRFVDVLVRNDDNDPPAQDFLSVWRARQDATTDIVIDPDFTLEKLVPLRAALPVYIVLDTRTMRVRATLANPDPTTLANRLHEEIAKLDGVASPTPSPVTRVNGRFTADQWDMVRAMASPPPPPPDPSNAKADDAAAAALGQTLFADKLLSSSGTVACQSCHQPARAFADGLPVPTAGALPGDRNAPSIVFASYGRWQTWDGRADTTWMQALLPLESASELATSRLAVAHAVAARYKAPYESIFGALPDLSNVARFPASGKPGDAAWAAMAPADQATVDRVFSNVGKTMAAYERTVRAKDLPLDAYLRGDGAALTAAEQDGLAAFFNAGCAQCHYGARLTDDAFHDVRTPTGRQDRQADTGRMDGIPLFSASEFRSDGAFSDVPAGFVARAVPEVWDWTRGSFKTPALRGVADTAPYGHGGALATLADVVEVHRIGGLDPSDPSSAGTADRWLPAFDASARDAIVTFLRTLTMPLP